MNLLPSHQSTSPHIVRKEAFSCKLFSSHIIYIELMDTIWCTEMMERSMHHPPLQFRAFHGVVPHPENLASDDRDAEPVRSARVIQYG